MSTWKGVLIEESVDDLSILSKMKVVGQKTTTLESEANRGILHFDSVEVEESNLQEVITFISSHLHKGEAWYFHLVNNDEMIVVFFNKIFRTNKEEAEKIEEIRQYGLSRGILKEQLGFEYLFENPFG